MNVNSKSIRAVKGFSLLAVSLLMFAGAPSVQANTYAVSANFSDGGIQGQTLFNGSFDWNGTSVTNFTGLLSESMWSWNGTAFGNKKGGTAGSQYLGDVYAKSYSTGDAPLLNLTNQLSSSTNGNLVTVTTFLKNSTDVVDGGGYNVNTSNGGSSYALGYNGGVNPDNAARNNNAFFTLVLDTSNLTDTTATKSGIAYGDMTALAMMAPMLTGWVGMTGIQGGGSMGGLPLSLSITAVPLPAAAWLFGSALISMFGASRRKRVLPA
jgi:hypothetical protein